jgi:peptidyl-prolyl cis-trans isomerase SurA
LAACALPAANPLRPAAKRPRSEPQASEAAGERSAGRRSRRATGAILAARLSRKARMTRRSLAAPLAAPASLLAVLLSPASRADEALIDGIAAQVGSEIVLVSEVMELVGPAEAEARAQGAPEEEIAKLEAEGLEQLIERRLLAKVVQDADLAASDADVDKAIEAIASDNGLSLDQLRASLASHGVGWEEYRARIRGEMERQKVINAMVGSQVQVEEHEVRSLYAELYGDQPEGGETVHVRQILVLGGEGTPRDLPTACAVAREAAARIAKGEPFEQLAREVSAAAPQHGGDIGWLHVDTMASWMKQEIAALKPGGVSSVIELPFGCTILELVERREFQPVSFEQAKEALHQEVYQRKVMDEYREWMENLRKRTFIERRGYFAQAARFAPPATDGRPLGAPAGSPAAEEPPALP